MNETMFDGHHGFQAWGIATIVVVMAVWASGCPVLVPLPVAEEPNYPPFIDPEDVSPRAFSVTVRRTESLNLEVSRFLDANEEENLSLFWLETEPTTGQQVALVTTLVSRDLSVPEPLVGVFYVYQGNRYEVDPCNFLWADRPELTISLLVSDGDIFFEQGEYTTVEGRYIDSYTWTIVFEGECP
ncbi:MAG: hypothetical protein AAFX99_20040 [Myxococcota bacterium]